ncbi:MAG: universal stress protein [Cyclobacteriaceae bacterium]|nr:universal stress protein [Cyclobacteriaceae bacterium]
MAVKQPPKLLLLTDFSHLARVALEYAIKMAGPLNAEFTVMNVVRLEGIPKANLKMRSIEKTLVDIAEEEGAKLVDELKNVAKGNFTIHFKALRSHTVPDAVTKFIDKNKVNMVVMGSRGASTLKKVRLGGTTVSVIDASKVPVLAIPAYAQYRNLQHLVYATDLKTAESELALITEFAEIFGSHVHMIHVAPVMDKKTEAEKVKAEQLVQKNGYAKLDFRIILDDDIPQAIDAFIRETKSDLLTTFTHHLTLQEKLFGRSVTRKLAYQGNIPLLAVKKK